MSKPAKIEKTTIATVETDVMPDQKDNVAMRAYAVKKARATVDLWKRTTESFWEMGVALAVIQDNYRDASEGKKKSEQAKFGDFLKSFMEEVGISQTYCYDSLKVGRFFPTAQDAGEYSFRQAIALASGRNKTKSIGYLPTDEEPKTETKPKSNPVPATIPMGSNDPVKDESAEPAEVIEQEPENPDDAVIARLNQVADEIQALVSEIKRLRTQGRIDVRKLDGARKDLTAIVSTVKKLPLEV